MASRAKEILDAIVARITPLDDVVWETNPYAVWYPDFERTELGEQGLTAIVFTPIVTFERHTRRSTLAGDYSAHIAVVAPMDNYTSQAAKIAAGEVVVNAAEAIVRNLLTQGIFAHEFAAPMKIDNEPVISADFARQYKLWVSYLKCEIVVNGGA